MSEAHWEIKDGVYLSTLTAFFAVSDFTETLAQLYEQHAEALQLLVSNYRKRNGELRKERLVGTHHK